MFLRLDHQKMEVFCASREFVLECYRVTQSLPSHEKFGMISQIRRAALSVHLNIAEGFSRKSERERKRYFEVSRGSIIEIDAALDIAAALEYLNGIKLEILGEKMLQAFKLVAGLIRSNLKN